MKKYFLYFLICITIGSCKKYPEGPRFSLRSKEARVIGRWEVESFLINGDDSASQLTCTEYDFISKEGNHHFGSPCFNGGAEGDWGFKNKAKDLVIQVDVGSSGTPFPITYSDSTRLVSGLIWEIQRLTNKQMWLKTNFNSKEYYIKFKLVFNNA